MTETNVTIALMIESDGPGGAESVLLALAEGLRDRGNRVLPVVLAGGDGWLSSKLVAAGFDVFHPRLERPLDIRFATTLGRWLQANHVELVHAHEFTMGFYAAACRILTRIPFVITMHGGTGFADALRRRVALAVAARFAKAIVGVSNETVLHLAQSLWISASRVTLVENGISFPTGDRMAGRDSLGLPPETRLILAVGNLYPVKGHKHLISAAAILDAQHDLPDWRIAVAGRGDLRPQLEAQISAAKLEHRVSLLGLRSDIGNLLAAADGWVMPSLNEGMPMALLEAGSLGLPVIASGVGGIPHLLDSGNAGRVVPPGDDSALAKALETLLRNPEDAKRRGDSLRASVLRTYSRASMTDRYLALYSR